MNTIISKRTSPFTYIKWVKINGQFHTDGPGIIINGGAGIVGGSELLSGRPLEKRSTLVPVGVMTFVDDEVLDKLMTIGKFQKDIDRGIITVVKGKKLDQEKGDDIADRDMIEDDHIPTRPVTQEEMENAGGQKSKDGSIDIGEVEEGDSPIKQRTIEAGQPDYVKQRMRENKKRDAAERKRASKRK